MTNCAKKLVRANQHHCGYATLAVRWAVEPTNRFIGPILLGCDKSEPKPSFSDGTPNRMSHPEHTDEEQVRLDVNRAFVHYPNCESPNSSSDTCSTF